MKNKFFFPLSLIKSATFGIYTNTTILREQIDILVDAIEPDGEISADECSLCFYVLTNNLSTVFVIIDVSSKYSCPEKSFKNVFSLLPIERSSVQKNTLFVYVDKEGVFTQIVVDIKFNYISTIRLSPSNLGVVLTQLNSLYFKNS